MRVQEGSACLLVDLHQLPAHKRQVPHLSGTTLNEVTFLLLHIQVDAAWKHDRLLHGQIRKPLASLESLETGIELDRECLAA